MQHNALVSLLLAVVILGAAVSTSAQVSYDPNQEKFMVLSLNQAYLGLGQAAKDFVRSKEQFEKKLISAESFDRTLTQYRQAKINYDLALMRILSNVSYIIVEEAIKKVMPDGKKIVEITVKNEAGGSFELAKLSAFGARSTEMTGGNWQDSSSPGSSLATAAENASLKENVSDYESFIQQTLPFIEGQGLAFSDVLNLLEISNIFISLLARTADNNEMVMISSPYERKILKLRQGERQMVRFELLRDVESLTIDIRFGDKTIQKPVYLKLESTAGGIEVTSENPSIQADLDSNATFSLNLQRFSSGSTAFALRIANLPMQIEYNFLDPDNNNQQIRSVNFTAGNIRKRIQLQLTMPTRRSERVQVDTNIPFTVLILNDEESRKFDKLRTEHGRDIPEEKLAELNAGLVDLSVTPLGVGRLEVSASTFYYPIQPDETIDMTISVKNTGTGEIKNIAIKADLPNNEWNYTIEPELIPSLDPEKEEKVKLTFTPPEDATVGEHILKVKVEAKTRNRIIEADDKEITVEIKAKPDIWGKLILIVLLIGIVLGIVIFGIKLSRR